MATPLDGFYLDAGQRLEIAVEGSALCGRFRGTSPYDAWFPIGGSFVVETSPGLYFLSFTLYGPATTAYAAFIDGFTGGAQVDPKTGRVELVRLAYGGAQTAPGGYSLILGAPAFDFRRIEALPAAEPAVRGHWKDSLRRG